MKEENLLDGVVWCYVSRFTTAWFLAILGVGCLLFSFWIIINPQGKSDMFIRGMVLIAVSGLLLLLSSIFVYPGNAGKRKKLYQLLACWKKVTKQSVLEFPTSPEMREVIRKLAFGLLAKKAIDATHAFEEQRRVLAELEKQTEWAKTWNDATIINHTRETLKQTLRKKTKLAKAKKKEYLTAYDFFVEVPSHGIGLFEELAGKADEFQMNPGRFQEICQLESLSEI